MTPSAVGVTYYAPLGAAGIVAPMGPFCKPHVQRGVLIGLTDALPRPERRDWFKNCAIKTKKFHSQAGKLCYNSVVEVVFSGCTKAVVHWF